LWRRLRYCSVGFWRLLDCEDRWAKCKALSQFVLSLVGGL